MSKIDLDAISDYVRRMEHTGSSPCYIETKQIRAMIAELKAARKVVEEARELVETQSLYRCPKLEAALKELEGSEK